MMVGRLTPMRPITKEEIERVDRENEDPLASARMLGMVIIASVVFYSGIGLWYFLG